MVETYKFIFVFLRDPVCIRVLLKENECIRNELENTVGNKRNLNLSSTQIALDLFIRSILFYHPYKNILIYVQLLLVPRTYVPNGMENHMYSENCLCGLLATCRWPVGSCVIIPTYLLQITSG